jgi:hypothetical protein
MLRSLALGLVLVLAGPAIAEEPPVEVTTDTQLYCDQLAAQVQSAKNPSPEALRLSSQGQSLCDGGEVVGGLKRLRRALAVLRSEQTP